MGNAVEAVGNTIGGVAQIAVGAPLAALGNDTVLKQGQRTAAYAGKKYEETGDQIVRTASDTIEVAGNAVGGTVVTAIGAVAKVTTGDDSLLKEGIKTLEYAGNKAIDAIIGKAKVTATATANISRPYNILFHSIHADAKVLQGVLSMAIIDPFLLLARGLLQDIAHSVIKSLLKSLATEVTKALSEITFSENETIDRALKRVWKPENLYARFNGTEQLHVSLKSELVQSLGVLLTRTFTIHVNVLQKRLGCQVTIDLGNGIFSVAVPIKALLDDIKRDICGQIRNEMGSSCDGCYISIDPSNDNIRVGLDAYIRVPR